MLVELVNRCFHFNI